MFIKFWAAVGATCSACLMSSRLPTRVCEMEASLSEVVPTASRLSATKLATSTAAVLTSAIAWGTSLGVLEDDCAVSHFLTRGVGRRQLNLPGGHQLRRQDHRLGVGGHVVSVGDPECDFGPCGLGFDFVDSPDGYAEHHDVVADEDAVAV